MPVDERIVWSDKGNKIEGSLKCDTCGNKFTQERSLEKGADKDSKWKAKETISDVLGQHQH